MDSIWGWINDQAAGIGATSGTLAAIVAIVTLIRATVDGRARSRPMVAAELSEARDSDMAFDLVVRNYGPTIARDVRVTFDPPLRPPASSSAQLVDAIIERYRASLSCLAPGQELRNIWWSGRAGPGNTMVNHLVTPDKATVTITFKGTRRRAYTEQFELRSELVTTQTHSVSDNSVLGLLRNLDRTMQRLTVILAEISEGLAPQGPSPMEGLVDDRRGEPTGGTVQG